MEEDNNITLWKYIKQHWKMLLLILLFPIVINALSFIPNFQIFNKPNSWTEVWAEYGGALLSAGIALVILYKQQKQNEKVNDAILKQNHEENEANRKQNELQNKLNLNLQINALKYQQQYNWYFELKNELTNLTIAWDLYLIKDFSIKISEFYLDKYANEATIKENTSSIVTVIDKNLSELDLKFTSCRLLFPEYSLDDKENQIWEEIDSINDYFYGLLQNLKFIIIFFPHPNTPNCKMEYEEQIKTLREEENEETYYKILYKKLEDFKFDFYRNPQTIIISLAEDFFNKTENHARPILNLLKYEHEKIDKLLDVEEINKNLNAN